MELIETLTPLNIITFIAIVLYLLGGQLFNDIKTYHAQKDIAIIDDLYFRLAWPFIVLFITLKV